MDPIWAGLSSYTFESSGVERPSPSRPPVAVAIGDSRRPGHGESGTNEVKDYDDAGNVTKKTDARNVNEDRLYDELNRVTDIKYPGDSTLDVVFGYDDAMSNGKGRLTSMDDDSGLTTFEYTEFGELKVETRVIDNVGFDPNDSNRNVCCVLRIQ